MNIKYEFPISIHTHCSEGIPTKSSSVMATSAELTRECDKELLLLRVNELVFVDALAGFECRRCERTLIKHYVAHCGHYFCHNCKQLLLQSKSNCPLPACRQPLMDMGHLRVCKETKEAALPVEIPGPSALETLMRELSIKFDKLSADVNKIKEETSRIDRSLKDVKTEVDRNKDDIDKKMAEMIKTLDEKTSENINSLLVFKEEVDNHNKDMEGKMAEMKKTLDEKTSENVNSQIVFKEDVEIKMAEMKKTFDGKSSETVNNLKDLKVEMEKKIKRVKTKVENNNVTDTKTEVENLKINFKMMTQKVELIKQEVIEESKRYTDGKVKEIISSLGKKLEEKMSKCKEKITTMEKTTRDNQLTKYNNELEQKLFNLESFNLLRNPQMDCFTLALNKFSFQPDFEWKISLLKQKLKRTTFKTKSEAFAWTGYPIQARAKIEVKQDGVVYLSLCLREINKGQSYHLKLIPTNVCP